MLDHISLPVADLARAKAFYVAALAPLGYKVLMEGEGYCGIGPAEGDHAWLGTIWLGQKPQGAGMHLAFRADAREAVDAFYRAALAAGATDNGAPGIRAEYHQNYYAAFVHDADGHNVEVVCQKG